MAIGIKLVDTRREAQLSQLLTPWLTGIVPAMDATPAR